MDRTALRFESLLAEIDGYLSDSEQRMDNIKKIYHESFFETLHELSQSFINNKISQDVYDNKIERLMECWQSIQIAIERVNFDEEF